MSIFSNIVKYLPILSKANWYYLDIAWYTSQLQNIVRWCKLQIQYFISLYILGCPEILVDIFRRGSSSITRMCVYLSGSQKSLKIAGCWKHWLKSCTIMNCRLSLIFFTPVCQIYCFCITVIGTKAPLELTHVKNR